MPLLHRALTHSELAVQAEPSGREDPSDCWELLTATLLLAAPSMMQSGEHPSPLRKFPSSHCSGGSRIPFPQMLSERDVWLPCEEAPEPEDTALLCAAEAREA
jgi:hypothetical protein